MRVVTSWRVRMALACAGMLSAGAHAAGYESRRVGDWTVAASRGGAGCFASRAFDRPGGTTLLLGLDADGTNHLSVLNANWSIAAQERLSLDFRLSRGGYLKHDAIGMVADGKQGFVTSFEWRFPTYLAASKALLITRGSVPVERLPLDGSSAAVKELRHCINVGRSADRGARPAPRSKDDIPLDPFAGTNRK